MLVDGEALMDAEPCGATGCLTCPMLGPDWRAEVARQLAMPDPTAADMTRPARRHLSAQTLLAWLTDDWQSSHALAVRYAMTHRGACMALKNLRERQPDRVEYSFRLGYRLRRSA